MTSVEEQTLYDVLEVEPRATAEEIRAAHVRAEEAFGTDSIAVYALVDEGQVEALRERLAEAAAVLLDPARRASYDRSIGLVLPGTLWDEDEEDAEGDDTSPDALEARAAPEEVEEGDEEEEEAEEGEEEEAPAGEASAEHAGAGAESRSAPPGTGAESRSERPVTPEGPLGEGPHPLVTEAALEPQATEAAGPEQGALDLDIGPSTGQFGRGEAVRTSGEPSASGADAAPASLAEVIVPPEVASPGPVPAPAEAPAALHQDWAAAVANTPPLADAAPPVAPPPEMREGAARSRAASPEGRDGTGRGRAAPPPLPRASFGLRKPAPAVARAEETAISPDGPGREREARVRLDIAPDAEFNGELLRRVRESQGLSLQQVAERTRITRIHLENVEADRYENLPATVYLRGILVNLARELRLDPARVSKSYLLVAQRAQTRG